MRYFKRTDGNYSQVDETTNPTDCKTYKDNYTEVSKQEYIEKTKVVEVEYKPTYEELVQSKIATKYSLADEIAILRQIDTKPREYAEYYNFCERCKDEAKRELNI